MLAADVGKFRVCVNLADCINLPSQYVSTNVPSTLNVTYVHFWRGKFVVMVMVCGVLDKPMINFMVVLLRMRLNKEEELSVPLPPVIEMMELDVDADEGGVFT